MFLQFLTPNGNPVYLRPELVAALAGYHKTVEGRAALCTRITLTNREDVFVRGDVDAIKDAVEAWHAEQRASSEYCNQCPALPRSAETFDVVTGEVLS